MIEAASKSGMSELSRYAGNLFLMLDVSNAPVLYSDQQYGRNTT